MDPAITGALIGVVGTLLGAIAGAALGYLATAWGQGRADRRTAAQQLAGLRQYLYHPKDQVDVSIELDRLAVSLAAAGSSTDSISALRKVALACNGSSRDFAARNPGQQAAVAENILQAYTHLVDSLSAVLQGSGNRKLRKTQLAQATQAVNAML